MAIYSGRNARVTIGGAAFKCKKWVIETRIDELDITNFESGGYGEFTGGVTDADITLELDLDIGASTTSLNAAIPGGFYALLCYTNSAAAPTGPNGLKWSFPTALCTGGGSTAGVRETISATVKFKSSGTFTLPA